MSGNGPTGIVRGAELGEPLRDVRVSRVAADGTIVEETRSGADGRWSVGALGPAERVVFTRPDFVPKSCEAPLPTVVRLLEDRLVGYHDRLRYTPGERLTAFVHAPTSFTATLCRHGLEKRVVLELGRFAACRQNVPNGDFVGSGLAWEPSVEYAVPNDAVPGLYSLMLRGDGETPFALPMVVSTPVPRRGANARVLVLASTNNWQTYNLWGGRSRYRNFAAGLSPDFLVLPRRRGGALRRSTSRFLPVPLKRGIRRLLKMRREPAPWFFDRLSVRRPTTNCQLEHDHPLQPFTNHLAGGEWRVLAWLERQGIPYDIVSGSELHRDPELLRHYRAIVLSTHCEYWSREMYEGLKRYHEGHGLWIVNLSGNTMYREVTYFDDGSLRCASLRFDASCADETQLLGVRFTPHDYGTCAPYRVLDPQHWLFDGVPFRDRLELFGGLSLNQNTPLDGGRYDPGRPGLEHGLERIGASGWETDKLSASAPKDFRIVAKGQNPKGGADMVIREPAGTRGGVFSASSIVFGGALLIDTVCSIVTANALGRALRG